MFDRELIEQYRSVLGDAGATQMVDLFVHTLHERTAELQRAVDLGDIAEVNRVGHAIKGMSAAVGATSLSACGLALQHATVDDLAELHTRFLDESAVAEAGVYLAWHLPAP